MNSTWKYEKKKEKKYKIFHKFWCYYKKVLQAVYKKIIINKNELLGNVPWLG